MAMMATDPAMASQPLVGRVRRWCPGEDGDSGWGSVFSELHNRDIFFDEEVVQGGTDQLDGGHVLFRLSPDTPRLSITELWHADTADILQAQEANRPLYERHALEGPTGTTLPTSEDRSHPSRGIRHPGGLVVRQFVPQGPTPNGAIGAPMHGAVQSELVQVDGYAQQQHPQHQQQPHIGMYGYMQQQPQHQPHPGYAQGWAAQPAAPRRQSPLSTVPVPSRPQVPVLVECPRLLSEGWQEDYRRAANAVVDLLLNRQAMQRTAASTVNHAGHFHTSGVQFAQQLRQQQNEALQREQQFRHMQQMGQVMYDPHGNYWWPAQQPQQPWMAVPQQIHGQMPTQCPL
mmetsp:Transcript_46/g.120  ORF Transcript_46/g.120 Transcript_46/m.120 type:complete len:344 (-) Transcript_46:183-1214(-)